VQPPPSPLVRVRDLSKIYRNGSGETRALRAASLELARAETTSLTGVSGSGKSTLISLLAGLMLPDSGEVVFDGEDITELDDFARANLRARRIGVVLQSGNLISFLSAAENVELAITLAGGERAPARARAARSPRSALPAAATTCPGGCPAARLSGWRSRWLWPTDPTCCSPTKSPASSIRRAPSA